MRLNANLIVVLVWAGLAIAYLFAAISAPIGWSQGSRAGIDVGFSDGAAILTEVDPAGPVGVVPMNVVYSLEAGGRMPRLVCGRR